jgi:hypothetical protein
MIDRVFLVSFFFQVTPFKECGVASKEHILRRLWRSRRKFQIHRYNIITHLRTWIRLDLQKKPIRDVFPFETRYQSQHGEDGVLKAIFKLIGETNRYFVEFGAGDGRECNSSYLSSKGWKGLLMDGRPWEGLSQEPVQQEFITVENINSLFKKYDVPDSFDMLSLDIDGNDYWIWKELSPRYRPRVVVVEFNANVDPEASLSIAYDATFKWDGSAYYGASLGAFKKLGESKGYELIGCESAGVNAFFVDKSLTPGKFLPREISEMYRSPIYGKYKNGYAKDPNRSLIPV